jgi:hypothetical protein
LIKNNFLRTGIPLETQATQKDEEEIRPRKDVAKKKTLRPRARLPPRSSLNFDMEYFLFR